MPREPIHEWCVEVDKLEAYDSALCIGPMKPHSYVGVVAPFMRYDETTLRVLPDGFEQLCVDYKEIPRLLQKNERVGARPLGFHHLWRTQSALLYAGYVHRVRDSTVPGVADVYRKCVPYTHHAKEKWDEGKLDGWLEGVVRASACGLYPHCKVRFAESSAQWTTKHIMFFVREHASFLIEKDSPELYNAVVRAFPTWPRFVHEIRDMCDYIRKSDASTKRIYTKIRLENKESWGAFIRARYPELTVPAFSTHLSEFKRIYETEGETALDWMRSLALQDGDDVCRAAAWEAWKDRFDVREIRDPVNRTSEPIYWYMCSKCGVFKSVTTKWGGCRDVCLDLRTMKARCHKKRGAGRKPLLTLIEKTQCARVDTGGCNGEIIQKPFGTHIVHIDFKAFVACVKCTEELVPFDHRRVMMRGYACDKCSVSAHERKCEVCTDPVSEDAFMIKAFDEKSGLRDVWFCRTHTNPKLRRHAEVWSMDLLMDRIYKGI